MRKTLGRTFDADIKIYNGSKYERESELQVRTTIENVTAWEVRELGEKEACERFGEVDPYNEYLTLYTENGSEATFRNSYVDMHIA